MAIEPATGDDQHIINPSIEEEHNEAFSVEVPEQRPPGARKKGTSDLLHDFRLPHSAIFRRGQIL